jgi:hypothetical protein
MVVARREEFNVARRRWALLAHDGRDLGLVVFVVVDFQVRLNHGLHR